MHGYAYRDLEFHIADSVTFHAFCRFGLADGCPSKSALQRNIKCLPAAYLEAINRLLVKRALAQGVESGSKARIDCTVTETNIHEPTDSSLLGDCVRVHSRLASEAQELSEMAFEDRTKVAKRRAVAIQKTAEQRLDLYKDLVKVTSGVRADALRVAAAPGVRDVAFSKSPGVEVQQMVSSRRIDRMLRNFREGIEAGIFWLKRALGLLTRCNGKWLEAFKSYVWSAVVTANLLTRARRGAC